MIGALVYKLKKGMQLEKHRKKWRARNKHNFTSAESFFEIDNVSVGNFTYGPLNIEHYYKPATLRIGNYCLIAKEVKFILGGNHDTNAITTYPFGPKIYGDYGVEKTSLKWKVDIIVEDDVWIGYDAIILPGVTIGQGSIIGARAIVTKDVPPYSVYVGTHIIRQRFPEQIIEKLLRIDFSKIKHHKRDSFMPFWNLEINEENVDKVIEAFCGTIEEKR